MYTKFSVVTLILALSPLTNALFFGLFSSKPTPKPDVIVSESAESETDKLVYENYLRSLASTYPQVQYVPVYTVQPQYTHYVQPQRSYVYSGAAVQSHQHKPASVQLQYTQLHPTTTSNVQFQKPITVLPSTQYQQISQNIPEVTQNLNKLIEAPSVDGAIPKIKTYEYEMPEPQMPTTLYDLPIPGISPDFRTGGYVTKAMTVSPSDSNKRSGRRFSHAYATGDGTKVSEEGQLVRYGNGQETVLKRGQYEYIDATGKPVLVKWIADDDGFRVVQ